MSPSMPMLAEICTHQHIPTGIPTGLSQAHLFLCVVVNPSLHCSEFFCSWAVTLRDLVLPLLFLHPLYLCVVKELVRCPWFLLFFFLLLIIGSGLTQVFAQMVPLAISLRDLGCFRWSWVWLLWMLVLRLLPSHSTTSGHWSVTNDHADQRISATCYTKNTNALWTIWAQIAQKIFDIVVKEATDSAFMRGSPSGLERLPTFLT